MDRLASITAYIVCDLLASGQLLRVLKGHPNLEMESVALYLHRRYMAAKVRVFIGMLVERFADEQRWLDAISNH
jgi:DNA-binding transcriptional LysR family regulator